MLTSGVLGTEIGAWQMLAPLILQLCEILSMITICKDEETEPWKGEGTVLGHLNNKRTSSV